MNTIYLKDINIVTDYPEIIDGKILNIDKGRDVNWVFKYNNSLYRLIINSDIQQGRWKNIQEFMKGSEVKELMKRKYIPRYALTDFKLEGFENGDVYKIVDEVYCVYDDMGDNFRTISQQLDCIKLICSISFFLQESKSDYFLADVGRFNIGFNYSKPVFVDIGSFSIIHYNDLVYTTIQKLLNDLGINNIQFDGDWSKLNEAIDRIEINLKKGAWGGYSNLSHLEYESKIAFDWLGSKTDVKTIIDVGCGNGEFSKLFCEKGYNVIAIDNNEYCVDTLYRNSYISNMNIFCMKMDITSEINSVLGKQWKDKVTSDVVFCSSIMHHLYHSPNKMTFEKQAELWNKICNKYLIIEYIDKKDECLVKWIFEEDYTKDNFLKTLDKNFELLDTKPSEYPDRCWYFFKKREHI